MKDPTRDIDRVIARALASEAETFTPKDLAAAEKRFLKGRRKRRFTWFGGATLATAAAIVAVAVFPRPELVKEDRPAPVAAGVTAAVDVGDAPTAVAASTEAVWVANSGDGTVSRIDPSSNEVVATIAVGGTPDEIAIGPDVIWVARSDNGSLLKIDPSSNEVISVGGGQVVGEAGPGHLDLAVHGSDLWAVDEEEGQVMRTTPEMTEYLPANLRATDVATLRGWPQWVYDGPSGELTLIAEMDGRAAPAMKPAVTDALTSTNGDLALGGDGIWVSDDFGMIMRVDHNTLEKTFADLGGAHSDLVFGDGHLWALTAEEEGAGATLRRLDPTSAKVVGEPVQLTGEPVDVSLGAGSAWVANRATDTVSRLDSP